MKLGSLLIRGLVGPLFIGHGGQKLFGWFGGPGLEGTAGFFESIGLRPGRRQATAAGVAETAGGALLTLGLATPVAAAMISGSMTTAIRKVHLKAGPWVSNGGWEFNAVVIAAVAGLAEAGPGPLSIDAKRFPDFHGPALAALAVAGGVASSYLATHPKLNPPGPAPSEGEGDVAGDPATQGAAPN